MDLEAQPGARPHRGQSSGRGRGGASLARTGGAGRRGIAGFRSSAPGGSSRARPVVFRGAATVCLRRMRALLLLLAALIAGATPLPSPPRARGGSPRAVAEARAPRFGADDFDAGQRHYARGEYRQAADAFGRAAARLEPARKPEARYWSGLSWLGAGDAVQARSAFEDVIAAGSPRRAFAELGMAQSWELAGQGDRA